MDEAALFDDATRNRLRGVITGRRAELHRRGRPRGERLFAEPPDRLVDRWGCTGARPTSTYPHDAVTSIGHRRHRTAICRGSQGADGPARHL